MFGTIKSARYQNIDHKLQEKHGDTLAYKIAPFSILAHGLKLTSNRRQWRFRRTWGTWLCNSVILKELISKPRFLFYLKLHIHIFQLVPISRGSGVTLYGYPISNICLNNLHIDHAYCDVKYLTFFGRFSAKKAPKLQIAPKKIAGPKSEHTQVYFTQNIPL